MPSADGGFGGAIVTNVFGETVLSSFGLGEGSASLLIDGDGQYLSHPVPAKTFGIEVGSGSTIPGDHGQPTQTAFLGVAGTLNVDGIAVAHQPIAFGSLVTNNEWIAITETPESALPSASLTKIFVVGLIVLAVAVVSAFLIARHISRPVGTLVKAAQGIAQGDVNQKIDVERGDEIGTLANSFRDMVSYLGEMRGAAESIAAGDVSVQVTPKSEADALGNAFVEMTGYLSGMADAAGRITDGDLTVQIAPRSDRDALAESFGGMTENLNELLGGVRTTAEALGSAKDQLAMAAEEAAEASGQVAQTMSDVATNTTQQSIGVQEVNDAVLAVTGAAESIEALARTQVADSAEEMADQAGSAAQGASAAVQTAETGATLVTNAVDAMGRIKAIVGTASGEIAQLGERSAEIGKIVAVIDDIAAQTNLLALNAAIEAARAGEQGRGFAVVADEVRKLAERVAQATKEIGGLIGGVQESVDRSVTAMKEGAEEMDAGSKVAAEAGSALDEIVTSVSTVNTQIDAVSASAGDLKSSGAEMVSQLGEILSGLRGATETVSSIAQVAEQNSAAAEEVSAAAEEMSAQVQEVTAASVKVGTMADDLKAGVSGFRVRSAVTAPTPIQRAA